MASARNGQGYIQAYPDPRGRGKISIESLLLTQAGGTGTQQRLTSDWIIPLAVLGGLSALSLYVVRDYLLRHGVSPVLVVSILLVWSGVVTLLSEMATPSLTKSPKPTSSARLSKDKRSKAGATRMPGTILLLMVCTTFESVGLVGALYQLGVPRVTMLVTMAHAWAPSLYARSESNDEAETSNRRLARLLLSALLLIATVIDYSASARNSSVYGVFYGYGFITLHLVAIGQRRDSVKAASELQGSDMAEARRARALATCLVGLLALPIAVTTYIISSQGRLASPDMPTIGTCLALTAPLALTTAALAPLLHDAISAHLPTQPQFRTAWPLAVGSTLAVGWLGFRSSDIVPVPDSLVAVSAWYVLGMLVSLDPQSMAVLTSNGAASFASAKDKQDDAAAAATSVETLVTFWRRLRATVKTILANPDSRKIYFFLCLNLAYMAVQMLWGIWTNSLGLISDSIHMFFDCAALAMGLFASVMATWEPNSTFTYGYGRVETLSGFANGIFLLLISIFIIFEAIQRLIDPPEMNTHQLLAVSFIGLLVNLVGMFATGHHHGGHGHSHGGGHSHAPTPVKPVHDHSHDHAHGHDDDDHDDDHDDHAQAHGHSHNMHGVFLHVMADTLGSVGVIISTLLINRYQWTGFDPIASIFIAVLIFASVVPLVTDSARVLCLDMGDDREAEVRKALAELHSVEGLRGFASPRFWPKDSSTIVGSIHVQLALSSSAFDPTKSSSGVPGTQHYANPERVIQRVERVLKRGISGLASLTVQVEPSTGLRQCHCLTGDGT
ncbi:hypothetical protein E5Q_04406 [Mixia osmundae IAM 14324]|uniref:Cation efflux protein transmembrane domain-containing protein n=1 Tax=Mixia osmundae (strain CBS 9802 / IAM 14324 / JCM 22182 / KY 12970) TaxID=764103 RepID=G7E4G7_MIXOS|nr:hypothetical protein E5Q_04406 [Mixia osmundae IAM 14324]